jgi:hypothetical protein
MTTMINADDTEPEVVDRARVAVAHYRRLSGSQKLAMLDRADDEYLTAILHAPIGHMDGFSRGYAEALLRRGAKGGA